jgi:serine/threonine protein kinase
LVDFGLSTIKAVFEGTSYAPSTVGGAIRWRAPELLDFTEEDFTPILTTACDIYSYGSVMLQVRAL